MSEPLSWDEALSAIELDIGGYRAILKHPQTPPYGEMFNQWECDDEYTKIYLEDATESVFKEFVVPRTKRGYADWAIMVGRAVAQRMNAKIVREKRFDPDEWPKDTRTPEELSDVEF